MKTVRDVQRDEIADVVEGLLHYSYAFLADGFDAGNRVSTGESDKLRIHCPQCGSELMKIAKNSSTTKLGLYTCDRCR